MLLSVITVCYNSEHFIERTILSVIALKRAMKDVEYIIVDGDSTDRTIGVVSKYKEYIDRIISEPDKGIYDAMNKGVGFASGEWICFMNSGDMFYKPEALADLHSVFQQAVNKLVVYGNWIMDFGKDKVPMKAEPIKLLQYRMVFNHQASFVKTAELRLHPFDLQYRIVADFNFFYHLYRTKGSCVFYHTKRIIALCDATSSTSFNNMFKIDLEHHKITSDNKTLHWRIAGAKIWLKRLLGKITGNENIRLNPFWKEMTFKNKR